MNKKDVRRSDKPLICKAKDPYYLNGVGGIVAVNRQIPVYSKGIGADVDPYLLDSTPNVLTIGGQNQNPAIC